VTEKNRTANEGSYRDKPPEDKPYAAK